MQSITFKAVLIYLCLLVASGLSYANGPCPDGEFNAQASVCMCPNGSTVGPNAYCNKGDSGGGGTYLKPMWGAYALDLPQERGSGFASSYESQSVANAGALRACAKTGKGCRVYLTFKNTCAAIAADVYGVVGGGVAIYEQDAERNALAQCKRNGGKNCVLWIKADCANSPR